MATTMKDVARQAGVDISTVSLAINNDPRIRTETRARIVGIAHELGYQKNFLARGLRSGRTFTIGAAVGGATAFWSEVLAGAQSVLAPRDYHLLLDYAGDSAQRNMSAQIESLKAKRVDGLLIAPPDDRFDPLSLNPDDDPKAQALCAYRSLHAENIPFVFVDRFVPGIDADVVAADNTAAARRATEYLIGRGHRAIAYLYTPQRMNTAQQERLQAHTDAMRAAGLEPLPWAAACRGANRSEEGKEALSALLAHPRHANTVTAVLAATDSTALGALSALDAAGRRVPGEISLVGIGGSPLMDYLNPPVTTVSLPMRELGIEAAHQLLARLEGDVSAYRSERMGVTLVERTSCGDWDSQATASS